MDYVFSIPPGSGKVKTVSREMRHEKSACDGAPEHSRGNGIQDMSLYAIAKAAVTASTMENRFPSSSDDIASIFVSMVLM